MNLHEFVETNRHDRGFTPSPCVEPTSARPGTPAKIQVLQQRIDLGQELFHPLDPQDHEGTAPTRNKYLNVRGGRPNPRPFGVIAERVFCEQQQEKKKPT